MKRNLLLVFAVTLLSFSVASAQITFQKAYGTSGSDFINDVQLTHDGGYIMAGYTNGAGAGSNDGYVVKTDANGDTLWTYTYGCTGDDRISSIKQTADSGYILSGATNSFGSGGGDVYLIKTDSVGNPLWQKTYGGSKSDGGGEVRQTADGGYILVGTIDSVDNANTLIKGVYIIKTDASGDTLWTRIYDGPNASTINTGGSICPTHDGGYVITGSAVQQDSANSDVFLLKIDANGHFLWDKFIGGPGNDGGGSVHETKDSGFVITGTTNSFGKGGSDFYLVKTDSSGNLKWSRTFGGGTTDEGGYGDQAADGGYYMIGEAGSFGPGIKSFLFVRTDANGDTLWTKTYAASGDLNLGITCKQTADGGFVLGGWHAVFHVGSVDFYLIKTDANGNSGPDVQVDHGAETSPVSFAVSRAITETSGGIITPIVTPGGGSSNDHNYCPPPLAITTAVQDGVFSVYPNPAGKQLIIHTENVTVKNVQIYTMLGELSLSPSIKESSDVTVDVSSLASGIYIIKMTGGNQSLVKKFVKE